MVKIKGKSKLTAINLAKKTKNNKNEIYVVVVVISTEGTSQRGNDIGGVRAFSTEEKAKEYVKKITGIDVYINQLDDPFERTIFEGTMIWKIIIDQIEPNDMNTNGKYLDEEENENPIFLNKMPSAKKLLEEGEEIEHYPIDETYEGETESNAGTEHIIKYEGRNYNVRSWDIEGETKYKVLLKD